MGAAMSRSDHDLWSLALKLSPYSWRLSAYLVVFDANGHRNRSGMFVMLRRLCDAVMHDLGINEDGEFIRDAAAELPDITTYPEAVKFLQDTDYLASMAFREQQWVADREGCNPTLLRWIDTVLRQCERRGIPMWARTIVVARADHRRRFVLGEVECEFGADPHNHGLAVELVHAVRGTALPPICWRLIGDLGQEFALRVDLEIEQGSVEPQQWVVADWREWVGRPSDSLDDPPASGARAFVRSPPGEVEMLLRYYGLDCN